MKMIWLLGLVALFGYIKTAESGCTWQTGSTSGLYYDNVCTGCPSRFVSFSKSNQCYTLILEPVTYMAARHRCASIHDGAYLVTINGVNETADIAALVQFQLPLIQQWCNSLWGHVFWIGAEPKTGGSCDPMVWKPDFLTVQTMNYTNWKAGQPTCDSDGDRCGTFSVEDGYTWSTHMCGLNLFCAICEYGPY